MTYKELLFKMSDKGMLTLSAEKDGRGLFWAGMDNMDSLDKPVNLDDFEYTTSETLRKTIAILDRDKLPELNPAHEAYQQTKNTCHK